MKKVIGLIGLLTISGCASKGEVYHGYTFNDLEKIDIKVHNLKHKTKKDLEAELGSPTFSEKIDGQTTYFYVEDVFKTKPIVGEDKLYSRVLRLDFKGDTVESVAMYKIEGKGYFNSKDYTVVKGHRMGFFEQMKRNLMSIGKSDDE